MPKKAKTAIANEHSHFKTFKGISSRAFEHPADRAALTSLRKVPGFDLVLRKMIGFVGERSLRYATLASAVRVNERQFPQLNAVYQRCLKTLDITERPELFVSQTPIVNAGAIGVDRPFIVLNSGTLALLTEDEIAYVLGHELGHVLADHVLYKTMLGLLLEIGQIAFAIPLGGLAIWAVSAALREWQRKSEISCDRAGLLCLQNVELAYRVQMKMAGGGAASEMSVSEFEQQAHDYSSGGNQLDSVAKLANLLNTSHPFHVLRLSELKRWVTSGAYEKILAGEYSHRDDDPHTSVYDEFKNSAKDYKQVYNESADPLIRAVRDIGNEMGRGASALWEQIKDQMSNRPEDKR